MQIQGKTVLITGGGGGIGSALGREFHSYGCRVMLCDKNAETLRAVADSRPGIHASPCDVTDDGAIDRLKEEVERTFGGLDILINNAAASLDYSFVRDTAALEKMALEVATNFRAPLRLIKLFMPLLLRSEEAAIVNVTSDLAHIPLSRKPTYTATKAALHAFSVALRDDLEDSNIRVFEVQPPPVNVGRKRDYYFGLGLQISTSVFAPAVVQAIRNDVFEIRIGQSQFTYLISRICPAYVRRMMNTKKYFKGKKPPASETAAGRS